MQITVKSYDRSIISSIVDDVNSINNVIKSCGILTVGDVINYFGCYIENIFNMKPEDFAKMIHIDDIKEIYNFDNRDTNLYPVWLSLRNYNLYKYGWEKPNVSIWFKYPQVDVSYSTLVPTVTYTIDIVFEMEHPIEL